MVAGMLLSWAHAVAVAAERKVLRRVVVKRRFGALLLRLRCHEVLVVFCGAVAERGKRPPPGV